MKKRLIKIRKKNYNILKNKNGYKRNKKVHKIKLFRTAKIIRILQNIGFDSNVIGNAAINQIRATRVICRFTTQGLPKYGN